MSRVTKIILICEGQRDSAFARGFLESASVDSRSVEPKVNPGGSGHDWVKNQFVEEVANLARFSEGRGVLGLIDEDGQGVAVREGEVAIRLQTRGLPAIASDQGRCMLLPTRNIETWLYWLTAQRKKVPIIIDETTDYKVVGPPTGSTRLGYEHCRPAGEYLHNLNHAQLPEDCPKMLGRALGQLRAFLKAVRR
jgi:hypothetical protein